MKKTITLMFMASILLFACKQKENKQKPKNENPFFSEYSTPFQTPPFDLIDTTHYIPAFEKGIAENQAEIDAIVNNASEPNFDNTIDALDKSGKLLAKVSNVFFPLNGANTNPSMQAINRKVTPMLTQHRDNISLNEKLFQRIKKVFQNKEKANLTPEQKRTLEKYYKDFVRNGADLNPADKEKLREINQKIATNQIAFEENHLAELNDNFKLVIDKKEDLDGLTPEIIAAAAEAAKNAKMEGKWIFTLQKPSWIPFLQYSTKRELREKLYRGYFMRGNNNNKNDNKEIMLNIMNLRAERAKLLGYKTHADYVISENMAKTPDKVYEFLHNLFTPAQIAAKRDLAEMQKIADKEGGKFKIESWDWWYYAEKLKKEKYNLDESEVRPYFALNNVRDGMFYVANKLYGITYTKLNNVPLYTSEVEAFEVKDAKGEHLGVLYLDYHPRAGKSAGAWCGSFRNASYENGKRIYPIIYIVCNFTRPSGDTPALLSWDETTTLFHEFGHSLHGLFSDGKYNRIAGNIPNDMVELPSQIMENWAGEPEVLKIYAKHYKTGEIIPDDLQKRLQKSLIFNEGFVTTEYIAASILDLDWHGFTEPKKLDVLAFEKQSMDKIQLMNEIIPRYRTTYFSHITGGYDAGYYVYLWAAVLDTDAFQAFVDSKDLYNKDLAEKFRKYILAEGGSDEGMIQYKKFRGADPSIEPLLKKRGLK